MSTTELKELAATLAGIAEGKEWECQWEVDGWGPPLGRDVEYCIANRVPIRLTPVPPVNPLHEVVAQMSLRGGSFVHALATAMRAADQENLAKLVKTFPEIIERYDALATATGKQSPADPG